MWDQLAVDIIVFGELPDIPVGATVSIPDLTEEFSYDTENSLRTIGARRIIVNDQEFPFSINQEV